MFEYASVSASAYDVNSLVGKLNEKASDGWEVVSIVPTGGDVTAFLKRSAASVNGESPDTVEEFAEVIVIGDVAAGDVEPVTPISEPSGWSSEPGTTATEEPAESDWSPAATGAAAVAGSEAAAGGSEWGPASTTATEEPPASSPEPEPEPVGAAAAAAAAPAPTPSSAPTTPAGWYPDPSGRYEMRYWDGDKWTEHVSRQGQTFTDPPVA